MGIVFHHEEITVEENRQRNEYLRRYYNPETGEGSDTGDRRILRLPDAPIPVQYIPKALFDNEMMAQRLVECGSLAGYAERYGHDKRIATDEAGRNPQLADSGDTTEELWREWIRVRIRYDFEFWAFSFVRIKDKLGAEDIPFRLNRPQRRILGMLEDMRTAGKPIRLILLKARQWGGSTLVQIYMAWIQLVHCRNWNSVICAHLKESAANIKGMYSKLLANYPDWLLDGEKPKFKPFERMANTSVIAGRECRVTIGSAESQESVRGIDAAMAHLSEVAFWRNSRMKSPEQVMRSICGSIMLLPCSMVVMESTANGTGSYFHQECERAKRGESFRPVVRNRDVHPADRRLRLVHRQPHRLRTHAMAQGSHARSNRLVSAETERVCPACRHDGRISQRRYRGILLLGRTSVRSHVGGKVASLLLSAAVRRRHSRQRTHRETILARNRIGS